MPEGWQELLDAGYALDIDNCRAYDVCQFFQKTTQHNFFCSKDITNARVSVHMKAPFSRVFEAFLKQLGADCHFSDNYAFIAKVGDPGLEARPISEGLQPEMTGGVSLDFHQVKLPDVTAFLAKMTGIPIEIDPSLKSQRVTISTRSIPFIEALDFLARYLQTSLEVQNGTIYIGQFRDQ